MPPIKIVSSGKDDCLNVSHSTKEWLDSDQSQSFGLWVAETVCT